MSTVAMADTFRRAAEVIRTGGLIRGDFEYGTAHCTVGALMVAKEIEIWDVKTVRSEVGHLAGLLGWTEEENVWFVMPGFNTVTRWNDSFDRTAEDVITLFEQAAEKLEADL